MTRYRLSRQARMDLSSILGYLDTYNKNASEKLESRFIESFRLLAANPEIGHFRQDIAPSEVSFWAVSGHVIAYFPATRPLQILAILHGARDIAGILNERDIV